MKLKLIPIVFILIGYCVSAKAQQLQLSVFIKPVIKTDSLINATLRLYLLPDTSLLATQVSAPAGNNFTVKPSQRYLLKATAIGYESQFKLIVVNDKPLSITILLKKNITSLSEVVVKSKKPLLTQEDDKTIVDATVLANSSTNAFEVLEKVPGAIIDQDGNVYLNSMTPATVFINGREMKLSSSDLASLLKSLPASSVSSIEILRNPSAKYDASSSGGIVNIVLKKGVKLGSNGSVNAAYFQGVYSTFTGGFNFNKSTGKVNSYLSYQFTNRNNFEELNTDRFFKTDSSLLLQKAFTTYPSSNHYVGGGVDIEITKKFNIGFDLRLSNTNGKSFAFNKIDSLRNANSAMFSKNGSDIANKNDAFFISNTLTSKYKIDTIGSQWTVEIDYNYYRNKNKQQYVNYNYLPVKPALLGDGSNSNNKNIFVIQTDLVLKLPKIFTVEAGLKLSTSSSNNSADYFLDTGNTGRHPDPYQTNTFKYRETIGAAYLQLSRTFFGFTLKPGLRFETTDITGRQLIPKDTTVSIKRTDIFPYVFLQHKLFKLFGTQLIANAIYRRSIKRPYYEVLNPYPKYVDQYLFDVGNPKLKPQFTTNYEFNVTYQNFPVLAVGLNLTKDIFSNVTYQNNFTKIAYRTWDNLGKSKEYYFRVIGGIPPGGKYFFYVGAQYNYNEYQGFYQQLPLNYSRGSWLFFMFQELKVGKTFTLDLQGFMRTKALQNFYELNTFGGLFFSANKSILKKKVSIILSVNDLLQTNHVDFSLNQGSVSAKGSRVNDTRRFGLTLRYNFGLSKPKENKEFGTPVDSKEN